eukprot:403376213
MVQTIDRLQQEFQKHLRFVQAIIEKVQDNVKFEGITILKDSMYSNEFPKVKDSRFNISFEWALIARNERISFDSVYTFRNKLILDQSTVFFQNNTELKQVTHLLLVNSALVNMNLVVPCIQFLKIKKQKQFYCGFAQTCNQNKFEFLVYASLDFSKVNLTADELLFIIEICEQASTLEISSKGGNLTIKDVEEIFPNAIFENEQLQADWKNQDGEWLIDYKKIENKEKINLTWFKDDPTKINN